MSATTGQASQVLRTPKKRRGETLASAVKPLLQRFEAYLKGGYVPLQLLQVPLQDFPLPLLVREQRLHPAEGFSPRGGGSRCDCPSRQPWRPRR